MLDKKYSLSAREKRRFKRLRVNLAVIYRVDKPISVRMKVGNREARSTMFDLSEGGLSMLTNLNIPVSSQLIMKFTLFKVDQEDVSFYGPMEIIGEVRYNIPLGGDEFRIGIRFKRIKREDKNEISGFVKSTIIP